MNFNPINHSATLHRVKPALHTSGVECRFLFLVLSLTDAGARWRQTATIKETKTYTQPHSRVKWVL